MLPPPPPPPPPPSGPPDPPKLNTAQKGDRNALLSQIRQGQKLRKAETTDKSKPLIPGAKPPVNEGPRNNAPPPKAASNGPIQGLGDIFAQGMPVLKPVGNRGNNGAIARKVVPPPPASESGNRKMTKVLPQRTAQPIAESLPKSENATNLNTSKSMLSIPSNTIHPSNFPSDIKINKVSRSSSQVIRPPPGSLKPVPPKKNPALSSLQGGAIPPPPPSKPPSLARRRSFNLDKNMNQLNNPTPPPSRNPPTVTNTSTLPFPSRTQSHPNINELQVKGGNLPPSKLTKTETFPARPRPQPPSTRPPPPPLRSPPPPPPPPHRTITHPAPPSQTRAVPPPPPMPARTSSSLGEFESKFSERFKPLGELPKPDFPSIATKTYPSKSAQLIQTRSTGTMRRVPPPPPPPPPSSSAPPTPRPLPRPPHTIGTTG